MWHAGKKHLHSKKGTFPKIGEAKKKVTGNESTPYLRCFWGGFNKPGASLHVCPSNCDPTVSSML